MINKLRLRFVLINMVIVSVLLSIMMTLVFRFNSYALEEQSISALRRIALMPEDDRGTEWGRHGFPTAYFTLRQTPEGFLVARGSDYFDLSDEDYLREVLAAVRENGEEMGVLEGYSLRFLRSGAHRGESVTFLDMSGEQVVVRNLRNSCISVGIASFVAFFLVSICLAFWAVRPVEKAWQQQRQFVADASHELKTPLSVIMANAELLQSEGGGDSRERFSGHILSSAYQMRFLVEQMLEMARVDSVKMTRVPTDLSQLVSDAVLSVQLLFEDAGRPLQSRLREDVFIRGSENHLFQLLDVLLDNALKYSQGEGAVEVELRTQRGWAVLTVSSPGPALTAQQCRDIFKRFYRVDRARTQNGSYGLGLSIAQGIVQGHRGTIRAASSGGKNIFTVTLPLCAAPERKPEEEALS